MSEEWLQAFDPNFDELLDFLLPQIDDGMLREVAGADNGYDLEENLAALKLFRDARTLPILDWCPREALELIRWSEPDQPDWGPGGQGRYGHLLRAFACSTLLRSYAREENHDSNMWHSFNETAVQLSESLRTLGDEFVPRGVKFLASCVQALTPLDEDGIEGPFLGLALLSFLPQAPEISDKAIVGLCTWIDERVEILWSKNELRVPRHMHWLLAINYFNQRDEKWIEIGRELQTWARTQPKSEKKTWVSRIGNLLAEGRA